MAVRSELDIGTMWHIRGEGTPMVAGGMQVA